jgi:uroporphyrinogen decarboxylase
MTTTKRAAKTSRMTSRERVFAAAAHKPTDRVPVDYCTRTDVARRLTRHLGLSEREELYKKLGIDIRKLSVGENHPAFNEKVNGILGGSSERSGARYIFHEDGSYENAWGIVSKPSENGLYDQWIRGPFSDTMDLDSFLWPGMDIIESVDSIRKRIEAFRGQYAVMGTMDYPFKTCWHMRGLENYLCDMLVEKTFASELLLRAASYQKEKGLRLIEAGADILSFSGDIAMQDRMMVQVDAWRELDKPVFAGMIKAFRKAKPDILVYYHSDGNMEEVIPDLVEIGVDIINPIQPECMNVTEIKRKYGDSITLHGTISIQRTLPNGTVTDVRREVTDRIMNCGQNGGLILAPSNHVQNDTPLENIIEIYRAAGSLEE